MRDSSHHRSEIRATSSEHRSGEEGDEEERSEEDGVEEDRSERDDGESQQTVDRGNLERLEINGRQHS